MENNNKNREREKSIEEVCDKMFEFKNRNKGRRTIERGEQ